METVAALLIGLVLGRFLPSYFAEKGRNLATKEDVATITELVEEVKAKFTLQHEEDAQQDRLDLQERTFQHELRLAALDRRLEAHQQAYKFWVQLVGHAGNNRKGMAQLVVECQGWWMRHCLYLSPKAREALADGYIAAAAYINLPPDIEADADENWPKLLRVGQLLVEAVALPSLAVDRNPELPSSRRPATASIGNGESRPPIA